jgi:hypothetical protein
VIFLKREREVGKVFLVGEIILVLHLFIYKIVSGVWRGWAWRRQKAKEVKKSEKKHLCTWLGTKLIIIFSSEGVVLVTRRAAEHRVSRGSQPVT